MSFNYAIIYGSVRETRVGIGAAKFMQQQLEGKGHSTVLIDPIEYELPLLNKMHKEYEEGLAPQPLETISEHLRKADGFVIVSAEYNHSVPPALKNLLDHFMPEYFFKPSGIVTYSAGSFGGVRAAVHLRAIVGELGMPSISSMFPIPKVQEAFAENGEAKDEAYVRRSGRFIAELEWYTEALKVQRTKGTPY